MFVLDMATTTAAVGKVIKTHNLSWPVGKEEEFSVTRREVCQLCFPSMITVFYPNNYYPRLM